jgi:hypothetical protein
MLVDKAVQTGGEVLQVVLPLANGEERGFFDRAPGCSGEVGARCIGMEFLDMDDKKAQPLCLSF